MTVNDDRSIPTDESARPPRPTLIIATVDAVNSAFPWLSAAIFLKLINWIAGSLDQTAPSVLTLTATVFRVLTELLIAPALIGGAAMALASLLRSCWRRWPIFS